MIKFCIHAEQHLLDSYIYMPRYSCLFLVLVRGSNIGG